MNCMRCGREIEEEQVFCADCLANMEKYPVKPGTAVQLPRRQTAAPMRKAAPRKKTLTLEEQVLKLKKQVKRLVVCLVLLLLIAAALAYPAAVHLLETRDFLPGQNYSAKDELVDHAQP